MRIIVRCIVSEEIRRRNIELSKGYPFPTGEGRLAVVGGGPSLLASLDRLASWPGDIWAVNDTAHVLESHGLRNVYFYSVDPQENLIWSYRDNLKRAVLAAHCDPGVFKAMEGRPVYRVDAFDTGPTSAVAAIMCAIEAGYNGITFFACESCYGERTHAYRCERIHDMVKVRCGSQEFLTKPELISQAQELSKVIRAFPEIYSEESGGLLSAMLQDDSFEVVAVSEGMAITQETIMAETVKRWGYKLGDDGKVESKVFDCAAGESVPDGWSDDPNKVAAKKKPDDQSTTTTTTTTTRR